MFCGFWYSASKRSVEIVTSPSGEPPLGGAKMPCRWRCMMSPVGVSTISGEPTWRWFCFGEVLCHERAVVSPSSAGTAVRAVLPT